MTSAPSATPLSSTGTLISTPYCDTEENVFDEPNVCCRHALLNDSGIVAFQFLSMTRFPAKSNNANSTLFACVKFNERKNIGR